MFHNFTDSHHQVHLSFWISFLLDLLLSRLKMLKFIHKFRRFSTNSTHVIQDGSRVLKGVNSIPGPKSFPVVGSLPYYLPIPGLRKYDPERILPSGIKKYKEFGPIFKENFFGQTLIFLIDPNDYQTILHTKGGQPWPRRKTHQILQHVRMNEDPQWHDNGGIFMENDKDWANIRHSFQKTLSLREIDRFAHGADAMSHSIVQKIKTKEAGMETLVNHDFLNVLFSYATDYMGWILFNEEWDSLTGCKDNSSFTGQLIWATTELNHATGLTDHGPSLWKRMKTPEYKLIRKCSQMLDEAVISALMKRRKDDGTLVPLNTDSLVDTWIKEGNQDFKQILTFCADMILAGIDTTAYSMSFMMYYLSTHRNVQEKLFEELKRLSPNKDEIMTAELITQTSYLKRCIKESLRLTPLSVGIGRVLTEDTVLSGYLVPEGTDVVTLNYVTGRLEEYVEQPDAFIPERWDTSRRMFKPIHPFVSIPFSHGPRACVGRRLAEQSMQIFLFKIFRNFYVEWIGPKPLDARFCLINHPDAPLLFKFTKRN